jgi:hypothetical protein
MIITGSAGNKLKAKLVEEQEIVMNLADILSMAFLTESAFLRVQKLSENSATDKQELTIKTTMAKMYLYDALTVARNAANTAIDSYAAGLEKAILKRLMRRMLRTYNINPKDTRRAIANYMIEKGGYYF